MLEARAASIESNTVREMGPQVLGSDRNLDKIMNFGREIDALRRFQQRYREWQGSITSEEDGHFDEMTDQWLEQQLAFMLSEFGCGKYLAVQPSYFEQVHNQDQRYTVTPVGLQAFGDQSERYVAANTRVGEGLMRLYDQLLTGGVGTFALLMSPTEEYREYNSQTDVVNLFRVVEKTDDGGVIVEGKYLVLGRVLSKSERRFIHNLAYALNQAGPESENWLEDVHTSELIGTESLWVDRTDDSSQAEHTLLVRKPNTFNLGEGEYLGENGLYFLAMSLDKLFKRKFGSDLIPEADLDMYLVIKNIVNREFKKGKQFLWVEQNKAKYYQFLRELLYQCQAAWARKWQPERLGEHLWDLITGQIIAGFEIPLEDSSNPFDHTWGLDNSMEQYCRTHDKWYLNYCPECRKNN